MLLIVLIKFTACSALYRTVNLHVYVTLHVNKESGGIEPLAQESFKIIGKFQVSHPYLITRYKSTSGLNSFYLVNSLKDSLLFSRLELKIKVAIPEISHF